MTPSKDKIMQNAGLLGIKLTAGAVCVNELDSTIPLHTLRGAR